MPIYETQCLVCGTEHEALVNKPAPRIVPPKIVDAYCPTCDEDTEHERFVSLCAPAKYLGEVPHNPRVCGGKFDTVGYASLPELPKVPHEMRWDDKAGREVECYKVDAIRDTFNTPEAKEIKAERAEVRKRNRAKKARDAAINRGENINFGRRKADRLPGDPKFT